MFYLCSVNPGFNFMPVPPFPSVEAAWFWAAAVLHAQHDPAAAPPPAGPCRVEDVVKCLDVLYRAGALELLHARILRIWGWRGLPPNPGHPRERSDWRLWREAIEALDAPLRARGIVAGPKRIISPDLLARAKTMMKERLPPPSSSRRGPG
jgi:hypothetical protein